MSFSSDLDGSIIELIAGIVFWYMVAVYIIYPWLRDKFSSFMERFKW